MHVWRADMRVYPMPRIEGAMGRFVMIVTVVATFMVVAAMLPKVLALHVDATVEIRVRLVHKCLADRLAGIAKRNGERTVAPHCLGHRVTKTRAQIRQATDMPEPQGQAQENPDMDIGAKLHHAYTRFRLMTTSASNMTTKT